MTSLQPQHDATPALKPHHIHNLVLILRHANAHYRRVASSVRRSLQPTHHAKARARRIGLGINTDKAVALAHKHVSVIPLPTLDIPTPSPDAMSLCSPTRSQRQWPPMWGVIPLPDIGPSQARGVHPDVPIDEGDAAVAWDMVCPPTGEISPLCIPAAVSPLPDAPGSSMITSSGSSMATSSGLPTPADAAPLMIRIKRKSAELAAGSVEAVQKRPRFLGKVFAEPLTQRRGRPRIGPPF